MRHKQNNELSAHQSSCVIFMFEYITVYTFVKYRMFLCNCKIVLRSILFLINRPALFRSYAAMDGDKYICMDSIRRACSPCRAFPLELLLQETCTLSPKNV